MAGPVRHNTLSSRQETNRVTNTVGVSVQDDGREFFASGAMRRRELKMPEASDDIYSSAGPSQASADHIALEVLPDGLSSPQGVRDFISKQYNSEKYTGQHIPISQGLLALCELDVQSTLFIRDMTDWSKDGDKFQRLFADAVTKFEVAAKTTVALYGRSNLAARASECLKRIAHLARNTDESSLKPMAFLALCNSKSARNVLSSIIDANTPNQPAYSTSDRPGNNLDPTIAQADIKVDKKLESLVDLQEFMLDKAEKLSVSEWRNQFHIRQFGRDSQRILTDAERKAFGFLDKAESGDDQIVKKQNRLRELAGVHLSAGASICSASWSAPAGKVLGFERAKLEGRFQVGYKLFTTAVGLAAIPTAVYAGRNACASARLTHSEIQGVCDSRGVGIAGAVFGTFGLLVGLAASLSPLKINNLTADILESGEWSNEGTLSEKDNPELKMLEKNAARSGYEKLGSVAESARNVSNAELRSGTREIHLGVSDAAATIVSKSMMTVSAALAFAWARYSAVNACSGATPLLCLGAGATQAGAGIGLAVSVLDIVEVLLKSEFRQKITELSYEKHTPKAIADAMNATRPTDRSGRLLTWIGYLGRPRATAERVHSWIIPRSLGRTKEHIE